MTDRPGAIERAFALAAQGYPLTAIIKQLQRENYAGVTALLDGKLLRRQLRAVTRECTQEAAIAR